MRVTGTGAPWEYDHPLEKRALARGYGIIVWQEQVVQLIMDVAGMTAAEADQLRRAFAKPNNAHLLARHWQRFLAGAQRNGLSETLARKIFGKINGHYMFPESHSHAFAITAYQAAWLKCHYPLEFFVALLNNQPMGFYPLETIKQDARRCGVPFLHPGVNRSQVVCTPERGAVRAGAATHPRTLARRRRGTIVQERDRHGPYRTAGDLVRRTGLPPPAVRSLVLAGAFDGLTPQRRAALWEADLPLRPARNGQVALPVSTAGRVPRLARLHGAPDRWPAGYRVLGLYPRGHLMEFVRPGLGPNVLRTVEVERRGDGDLGDGGRAGRWPGSIPAGRTARCS